MILSTPKVSDYDADDIVTINAGGKMFQVLRRTLCLPPGDTAFTKLFSTSNSHSYSTTYNSVKAKNDANDNVFLDHDPQLIEIIIDFLRMKSIEDPFDPIVEPPEVPAKKSKDFRRLLNHFGLTAFFYYPSVPSISTATSSCSVSNATSIDHPIRNMSFDRHEVVSSFQNSFADNSIAQRFDYCYG